MNRTTSRNRMNKADGTGLPPILWCALGGAG
jgi:hypothetical protein